MKTKSFLHNSVFITLPSILVFFIFLEISLRAGGYIYMRYRHSGEQTGISASAQDSFNILCLGDSFTLGMGASPEDSYPRHLAHLLKEKLPQDIEVIEQGRGGNTSSLLLRSLQQDIYKYHPKIVIIMIGMNNHWNFQESSYFILNRDNLSFKERLDSLLSGLRVFKLMQIACLNFWHRLYKNNKKLTQINIDPRSAELSKAGRESFACGRYDLAMNKLKQAIAVDKNNYEAHLWLAQAWIAQGEFQLAKNEVWQALRSCDELNEEILCDIINRLTRLDNEELELANIKEYIRYKFTEDKKRRLYRIIDAHLHMLKHHEILKKVLESDLKEIISLAKANNIGIILQTYPTQWEDNSIVRKISSAYNIPLVDNEAVFKEKEKLINIKEFFALDGHCNAFGYKLIAENVYNALIYSNLVPYNKK